MKVQGNGLNNWDTGASAHTTRMGGRADATPGKIFVGFSSMPPNRPPLPLEFCTALPGDRARSTDQESPRF